MMSGNDDIEELEKIFKEIEEIKGWNTKQALFWIFDLYDREKWKLEAIFNQVQSWGFKMGDMSVVDEKIWCMSLTKFEILTAKELYLINQELIGLSEDYSIERYEGWDVGKNEPSNK